MRYFRLAKNITPYNSITYRDQIFNFFNPSEVRKELKWKRIKEHLKSRKGKLILFIGTYVLFLSSYIGYHKIINSDFYVNFKIEHKNYFQTSDFSKKIPTYSMYENSSNLSQVGNFYTWRDSCKLKLRELFEFQNIDEKDFEIRKIESWSVENISTTVFKVKSPFVPDSIVFYKLSNNLHINKSLPVLLFIAGTGRYSELGLIGELDDYHKSAAKKFAKLGYTVYVYVRYASIVRDIKIPDYLKGYDPQLVVGQRGFFGLGPTFASIQINEFNFLSMLIKKLNPNQKLGSVGISAGGYISASLLSLSDYVDFNISRSGLLDNSQVTSFSGTNQPIPPYFSKYFNDLDLLLISYPKKSFILYGKKSLGNLNPDPIYQEMKISTIEKRFTDLAKMYSLSNFAFFDQNNNGHAFDNLKIIDVWIKGKIK